MQSQKGIPPGQEELLPLFSREVPVSVSSAKKGGSIGKMVTLSRLGIFLPPTCVRLKGFELQNIMVGFIKRYRQD